MATTYDQVVPSLSTDNWLTSKEAIIEKVFIYFLAGEVSQTNIYRNQVYTLKEITQSTKEEGGIKGKIEDYLKSLYSPYFPSVEPKVTLEELDDEIRYIIDIDFKDEEGKNYNLNRILQMKNNDILNYQELLSNYKILK